MDYEIIIKLDLPSTDPADVKIGVMDNLLKIQSQKSKSGEDKKISCSYAEECLGGFNQTIQLPVPVIPDEVDAEYKDDVLAIKVSMREDAKPKRILLHSA